VDFNFFTAVSDKYELTMDGNGWNADEMKKEKGKKNPCTEKTQSKKN